MIEKTELLETIAGKNRGLLATVADRQSILTAIARVEALNPTLRPLEALNLLEGNWRLTYTTSRGLLNIDQFPLLKLGQIYQFIRTREAKIYNIAEVYGLPYLEGLISVAAEFQPISDHRVEVRFQRSILGLQRLLNYQSATDFVEKIEAGGKFTAIDFNIAQGEQQGWLDITYLDQDLRIGRGNEGSIFVLVKAL